MEGLKFLPQYPDNHAPGGFFCFVIRNGSFNNASFKGLLQTKSSQAR